MNIRSHQRGDSRYHHCGSTGQRQPSKCIPTRDLGEQRNLSGSLQHSRAAQLVDRQRKKIIALGNTGSRRNLDGDSLARPATLFEKIHNTRSGGIQQVHLLAARIVYEYLLVERMPQ